MNTRNFTHQSNVFFGCTLFGRDFTAFVQRVSLPGISFSNIELSKMAVKFYTQGDTPTYEPLSLDLIVDSELKIWREIIQTFQEMTKQGVGDNSDRTFETFIHIFNERDESVIKIDYKHCILESIGNLEFDATSEDTEITLSLTINYAYFQFDNKVENSKNIIEKYRKNTFIKHLGASNG